MSQEAVGVLVDSSEVSSGGNVLSRLRLHYGAHTAVVHLTHAHYAVSARMAVARLPFAGRLCRSLLFKIFVFI